MMTACHIIVMGVSGCGKSTLGRALASELGWPFIEGDDYHSAANRAKMAAGAPLTNADRLGWIEALSRAICATGPGAVIACSALNGQVRGWIEAGIGHRPLYLLLEGEQDLVRERLEQRQGHFMNPGLLASQYEALEPPPEAVSIPVSLAPLAQLGLALEAVRRRTEI